MFTSQVTPGGNADICGIIPNDKVVSINGQLAENLTIPDAQDIIKNVATEFNMFITRSAVLLMLLLLRATSMTHIGIVVYNHDMYTYMRV